CCFPASARRCPCSSRRCRRWSSTSSCCCRTRRSPPRTAPGLQAVRDCRAVVSSLCNLSLGSPCGQVLDARCDIENWSATGRRLLPGDGGVLLEHEPALVARVVERAEHLFDPRVSLSEGPEEPPLRRLDERQLARTQARGDFGVHVLEVGVDDTA